MGWSSADCDHIFSITGFSNGTTYTSGARTGSDALVDFLLSISTTEAMYAAVGLYFDSNVVHNFDSSSIFRTIGIIFICSICSASSEVESASNSGGKPPVERSVGGAREERIASLLSTGVS